MSAFQRFAQITTGSTMKAANVNANPMTVLKANIGKLRIVLVFVRFQKIVQQLKPPIKIIIIISMRKNANADVQDQLSTAILFPANSTTVR